MEKHLTLVLKKKMLITLMIGRKYILKGISLNFLCIRYLNHVSIVGKVLKVEMRQRELQGEEISREKRQNLQSAKAANFRSTRQ